MDLQQRILQITNPNLLSQWLDVAFEHPSLEAFQEAVKGDTTEIATN